MPDESYFDFVLPQAFPTSRVNSFERLPLTTTDIPNHQRLPFRQHFLWSAASLFFMTYLTIVLYLFLTSSSFRYFVVQRANTLFAVPYVLSLLVVLFCLAPCSTGSPRPRFDTRISSPADCIFILLVLLEWATCIVLVLLTLIAIHDHLSYVSPDGVIIPTNSSSTLTPSKIPPQPSNGLSHDSIVVLLIPIFFAYTLFNCILYLYSFIEATWRVRTNYTDLD